MVAKSCRKCGELKDADQFCKVQKFYTDSWCRKCKNTQALPVVKHHQQTTSEGAVKNRNPWTTEELDELSAMAAEGLTGAQMARKLGRSLYAVYTMKHKLEKEQES